MFRSADAQEFSISCISMTAEKSSGRLYRAYMKPPFAPQTEPLNG